MGTRSDPLQGGVSRVTPPEEFSGHPILGSTGPPSRITKGCDTCDTTPSRAPPWGSRMTAPAPRVATYSRVSTLEQDEDRQVRDLRRVAAERGGTVVEEIRERLRGTRTDRPGLARVLDLARSGRIDVLLTWELSRLTRGGIGDLFDIVRALDAAKVRIESVQEPWVSVGGPTRDLLLAVLGWASKMERDLLSERTKSGLAHARAMGRQIGRPRRLTPELEARIRELRGRGLKWSVVAQYVGLPAGTCRKVRPAPPSENPRVENPLRDFGTQSDGS